MNAVLIPLALIGAITVVRWARAQCRAYGGINRPWGWYMRPQ